MGVVEGPKSDSFKNPKMCEMGQGRTKKKKKKFWGLGNRRGEKKKKWAQKKIWGGKKKWAEKRRREKNL
ncbi:hypothetical protein RKK42_31245 [Klebsiella pneumoniae]|nr:hypothetical protein [Klebsiella pneumoniae]